MFKEFKVGDHCEVRYVGEITEIKKTLSGKILYTVKSSPQEEGFCWIEEDEIFPLPEPEKVKNARA